MMIAIVNVSKDPKPTGPHPYEVRINHRVIARFTHQREQGLSVCLYRAAFAVAKEKLDRSTIFSDILR